MPTTSTRAAAAPPAPAAVASAAGALVTYGTAGALALAPAPQPVTAPVLAGPTGEQARALARRERPAETLATATATQRARAHERLSWLQALWALRGQGRSLEDAVALTRTQADRWPTLADGRKHQTQICAANARRWLAKLGATWKQAATPAWHQSDALIDQYSRGARLPHPQQRWPAFWLYMGAAYEHPNAPELSPAYEHACREFRRAHPLALADAIPGLDQVAYWYRTHADQAGLVLARQGSEVFRNTVAPYIVRDWSAVRVGQIWIGDHHQLDAWCKVPDGQGGWIARRVWLTAWLDAKSGYLVGARLTDGDDDYPNSSWIWEALYVAIEHAGRVPPEVLYIDNGKDYKKHGFIEDVLAGETPHSVVRELGCRITHALPYNARAKTIERQFGEVCSRFSVHTIGYWGNNPQRRPEYSEEIQAKHPELYPTVQQFAEHFSRWVAEDFHARSGESRVTGGRPPAELWAERTPHRAPFTADSLGLAMLLPVQTRLVGRGYSVKLQHPYRPHPSGYHEYRSDDLRSHFGSRVLVKIHPLLNDRVWVFDLEGRLLAEARHPELRGELLPAIDAPAELLSLALKGQRQAVIDARSTWRANLGDAAPGASDRTPIEDQAQSMAELVGAPATEPAPTQPSVTLGTPRTAGRLAQADAEAAPRAAADPAMTKQLYQILHQPAETPAGQEAPTSDLAAQLAALRDAGDLR